MERTRKESRVKKIKVMCKQMSKNTGIRTRWKRNRTKSEED
jgi:hypothetical protein